MSKEQEMTLNEYQQKAMTTCMESSHNISYMVHGLCEESGEVAGKISKAIRKGIITINGNHLYQTSSTEEQFEEFEESLKKEAGDCAWMLAGICDVMGWSLGDVCKMNLDKLQDRQKRGVIDSKGDNR